MSENPRRHTKALSNDLGRGTQALSNESRRHIPVPTYQEELQPTSPMQKSDTTGTPLKRESDQQDSTVTGFQHLILGSVEEELSCSYAFLLSFPTKDLKLCLRRARRTITGSRSVLRARLQLHLHSELHKGINPLQSLASLNCAGLNEFMDGRVRDIWKPSPKIENLFKLLPRDGQEEAQFRFELSMESVAAELDCDVEGAEHSRGPVRLPENVPADRSPLTPIESKKGSKSHGGTRDLSPRKVNVTDFSLDEFARLALLLRFDDETKRLVIKTMRTLSREDQDGGVKRGDFWVSIATRFNDPKFQPQFAFDEPIAFVNPNKPPPVYRTGKKLFEVLRQSRSVWTQVLSRYNASGNNGEVPFVDFCHKTASTRQLSAVGKRTYIFYCVFGLDDGYADDFFHCFLSREIPFGQGLTPGINHYDAERSKRRASEPERSPSARKRRKESEGYGEYLSELNSSMKEFAATDKQRLSFEMEKESKKDRRREQRSVHDSNTGKTATIAESVLDGSSVNEATKNVMAAFKELKDAEKNAPHLVPIAQAGLDAVIEIQKKVLAALAEKKANNRNKRSDLD